MLKQQRIPTLDQKLKYCYKPMWTPEWCYQCALNGILSLGKVRWFFLFSSKVTEMHCCAKQNICPTDHVFYRTLCSWIHIKLPFCWKVVFFVLHQANWHSKDVSNKEAYLSLLLRVSARFQKQGLVFYQKSVELFLWSNVRKTTEAIYQSWCPPDKPGSCAPDQVMLKLCTDGQVSGVYPQ